MEIIGFHPRKRERRLAIEAEDGTNAGPFRSCAKLRLNGHPSWEKGRSALPSAAVIPV